MKKIKNLFLSLIIIGFSSLALVGCGAFENAEKISIVEMPTTTFVKGQEPTGNLMKVLIIDKDGKDVVLTLSYPDENGNVTAQQAGVPFEVTITIKNFDLSTIGNKTASVTYGEATSYFDYQVVDPEQGFAGGNGTLNNPYQITTPQQFVNINTLESTKNVYFKLMNDIDLSAVLEDSKMYWDMGNAVINFFEGVFDGNNKRIYNVLDPVSYLFGELAGATIKDLSVFVNGKDISLSCNAYSYDGRTLSFLNVDMYGTVSSGYNYASYAIYPITLEYAATEKGSWAWVYSTVVFEDCDSYIDNIGMSTRVSVFFAIPRGNYTFENCYNYGHVEALNTSLLFTNLYASVDSGRNTSYKVINSGNRGTLSSVEAKSDLIACHGANAWTLDKQEGSEELVEGTNLVIPELDFTKYLQVQDNSLELKAVTDENVAKIKINLYFEGMSCNDYGTLTDFVTVEIPVNTETQKTGLFATEIKDGKILIKVVTKGTIEDTTELTDEMVTFEGKEWLAYNVTKGFYVFDGTKLMEGYTFTAGSQNFSVFAYNAEDEVVSSVKIKTK